MRYIGIDLAITGKHCAAVLDEKGHVLRQGLLFRTKSNELTQLLELARKGATAEEELAAVMEPTGLAWLPIARYLNQHEVTVYMMGTRQMAALRKYYHYHVKGDRTDAVILAQSFFIDSNNMVPLYLPSAKILAGQRWCKQYDQLIQHSTAIRQRVWAWEHELWPGLEAAIGTSWSKWTLPWRKSPWYLPERLLQAKLAQVTAALATFGVPEDQVRQLAEALRQAARDCVALRGPNSRARYQDLQISVEIELQAWEFHHMQLADLKKRIVELYRELQPQRLLETIQGVGELSAAVYTFSSAISSVFPRKLAFVAGQA